MSEDSDKDKERILKRIRDLYRMSQDTGSPNEAAIAAKRVRKLMDEHQIGLADLEQSAFSTQMASQTYRAMPLWYTSLAIAMANLNDCIVRRDRMENRLKFQGFDADVIVCLLSMEYLVNEMKRQLKASGFTRRGETGSFRVGFADGIARQVDAILAERRTLKTSTGTALVAVKKAAVESEFGIVRYGSRSYSAQSGEATEAGYDAGIRTSLNTQVAGTRKPALS